MKRFLMTLMTTDSMTIKSRCSSGVEHFLGKEEVVSSILINGSKMIVMRSHLKRLPE
jgi:hypothetical protein